MLGKVTTIFFLLLLVCFYGGAVFADDPQEISRSISSSPDLIAQGRTLYMGNCLSCHGSEGGGDGPAAIAFDPRPRNFTSEKFKQGSSPSAVFYTISNGLGSMPSFSSLSVLDRLALVHYLLSLTPNREEDTPESLAKIGLDPTGKPLTGFKIQELQELPVEFIMERMASDGNPGLLNYKELEQKMAKETEKQVTPIIAQPDLKRGEVLFESCKTCHGAKGEGSELAHAPQIAGQDADYIIRTIKKFQTGARGAHPEDVNGLRMRPMSRMLRNDDEVLAVAHYINGLIPQKTRATLTDGNAEKGRALFATCIACHGVDARGVKALNAPSLVNLQDWYVMTQIHNFKAGYRGVDPGDVTGATMRGMAMSLPDDQAIKDVMAFLRTLQ